ncbi:MAG: hypothetical protein R3Y29_02665 [bacterium]
MDFAKKDFIGLMDIYLGEVLHILETIKTMNYAVSKKIKKFFI